MQLDNETRATLEERIRRYYAPTVIRMGPLHPDRVPAGWMECRVVCDAGIDQLVHAPGDRPMAMVPINLQRTGRVSLLPEMIGPLGGHSFWLYAGHCRHCGMVHWAIGESEK